MLRRIFVTALAASAFALAGCGASPNLHTPAGFAELDDQDPYAYRATTAKGVVIAVHEQPNEPRADAAFWTTALDARLRREGYAHQSTLAVKSAAGLPGQQLRYTRDEDRREYRYWLTVFVTEDRVFVVEAAGDKEHFDPEQRTVEGAVLSLRTN